MVDVPFPGAFAITGILRRPGGHPGGRRGERAGRWRPGRRGRGVSTPHLRRRHGQRVGRRRLPVRRRRRRRRRRLALRSSYRLGTPGRLLRLRPTGHARRKTGQRGVGASGAPAAREAADRPDERPLRAPYAVLHAARIMTRAPFSTKVAAADPESITGGLSVRFSEQVALAERTLPPRPTASPSPRTAHRTGTAVRGRTGRSFRLPVQRPRRKKCGLRAGEGPLTDGATYES